MVIANILGIMFLPILSLVSMYVCERIAYHSHYHWKLFWLFAGIVSGLFFSFVAGGLSVYIWMV